MFKKLVILISVFLLFLTCFQYVEAKRFGGGSNHGYMRSEPFKKNHNATGYSTSSTNNVKHDYKKNLNNNSFMSNFSRILTTLGIAAMFAWIFSSSNGIMFFIFLISVILLISLFFRKKVFESPRKNNRNSTNIFTDSVSSLKKMLNCDNNNSNKDKLSEESLNNGNNNHTNDTIPDNTQKEKNSCFIEDSKLPDGTPSVVFKHQSISIFNILQQSHDSDSLKKIKMYVTDNLYASIEKSIIDNDEKAIFRNIKVNIIDFFREGKYWTSTVLFTGEINESNTSIIEDNTSNKNISWNKFEEIWYFTRQDSEHLWLVKGIQQKTITSDIK